MAETLILIGTVAALIGAVVASYQLILIRRALGPLFQADIGVIVVEHLLLGVLWMVLLLLWAIIAQIELIPRVIEQGFAAVVAVLIAVIIWGFVIRAHFWYQHRKDND